MKSYLAAVAITLIAAWPVMASVYDQKPFVAAGFDGSRLKPDKSMDRAAVFTNLTSYAGSISNGWKEFADAPNYRWWVTWIDVPQQGLSVSLKSALRVESGSATQVEILTAHAACNRDGVGGAIWDVTVDKYQIPLPDPISESSTKQPIPLPIHSMLAKAIFAVCRRLNTR